MAKLIGGLGTSHVPSISLALDKGLRDTAEWKPFFDGYIPGQQWVRENKPDVAVVIFNDHGNSFFLDRIPTFAVGCAEEYRPVDEGWGPRAIPPFQGAVDFSWHLIDTLVENRFDPMICQEIEVDHGLQVPMELFLGAPRGGMAGAGGADLRQRDPVPDPAAEPLLRDGADPAAGDRELRVRRALRRDGHRRPLAPAARRARRLCEP
jgi:hypothetical protein